MKDIFKKLIKEFHEAALPDIIKRDYSLKESEEIITLIGLRRVGKTYLLYQKIKELVDKGIPINMVVFINFEDDRLLGIKAEDMDKLLEAYYELYPNSVSERVYLFFDEIHAAPAWNYFLKRLYEKKQYRIFITGSSSKLLSSELATELRGRTIPYKIYPLSFKEFLKFKKFEIEKNIEHSKKRYKLKKLFREYLEFGGYPLVAKYDNALEKESTLRNYLELIIYKDVVDRFKVRNTALLKSLIKYLATNTAKAASLNSFYESAKAEIAASKDSVFEYFSYLEEVNFIYALPKFSYSVKKQMNIPKKIYLADNGFKTIFGLNFSEDYGRLLENLVFIELKRRGKEIYYYSEAKNECDFVIKNNLKITEAIQVTKSMEDNKTKQREIDGLAEALKKFKLQKGIIITEDEFKDMVYEGLKISVRPIWFWLLNKEE